MDVRFKFLFSLMKLSIKNENEISCAGWLWFSALFQKVSLREGLFGRKRWLCLMGGCILRIPQRSILPDKTDERRGHSIHARRLRRLLALEQSRGRCLDTLGHLHSTSKSLGSHCIQLATDGYPGRSGGDWRTWVMEFQFPGLMWSSFGCCGHLRSEPVD